MKFILALLFIFAFTWNIGNAERFIYEEGAWRISHDIDDFEDRESINVSTNSADGEANMQILAQVGHGGLTVIMFINNNPCEGGEPNIDFNKPSGNFKFRVKKREVIETFGFWPQQTLGEEEKRDLFLLNTTKQLIDELFVGDVIKVRFNDNHCPTYPHIDFEFTIKDFSIVFDKYIKPILLK